MQKNIEEAGIEEKSDIIIDYKQIEVKTKQAHDLIVEEIEEEEKVSEHS